MKKYNVLLSLAAMVMAAGSCGKEQLSENVTHDTDPGFPATEVANTLKAHVEGSELTMAVAESDASGILLAFAEGDQITVFKAADGISAVYSCSAVEAGVATFTVFSGTAPSASDNIVAVYCPGSTPAWVSSSSISITTAAVQSAATSGYSVSSIPLVAYGTAGGDLTFKAVGGVLELSLDVADGDFCSIGSIEVTALGAEDFITGCYAVDYTAATPALAYTSEGAKVQTYTYTGGIDLSTTTAKFYIGLPAGTHDLKVKLVGTDGAYMEKTGEGIVINSGKARRTALTFAAQGRAISTAAQLRAFADHFNNHTILYRDAEITADIDISGSEWQPIGSFNHRYSGTFDGKGHTISGLTIKAVAEADSVGLFRHIDGATIKDVKMANVDIAARDYIGSVVAAGESSLIDNCFLLSGTINGRMIIGGIAGHLSAISSGTPSVIRFCSNAAQITAATDVDNDSRTGGVIGICHKYAHAIACWNSGTISGAKKTGGVIGHFYDNSSTSFSKYCAGCFNTGSISGSVVGGLMGSSQPANAAITTNIIACYNTGAVQYGAVSTRIGAMIGNKQTSNPYNLDADFYVRDASLGGVGTCLATISELNTKVTEMNTELAKATAALGTPNYRFVAGTDSTPPTLTISE